MPWLGPLTSCCSLQDQGHATQHILVEGTTIDSSSSFDGITTIIHMPPALTWADWPSWEGMVHLLQIWFRANVPGRVARGCLHQVCRSLSKLFCPCGLSPLSSPGIDKSWSEDGSWHYGSAHKTHIFTSCNHRSCMKSIQSNDTSSAMLSKSQINRIIVHCQSCNLIL